MLFSLTSSALAGIGSIETLTGKGAIERNSERIPGETGLEIESYDAAVTAKGVMRIVFVDDTEVEVTEHSRLVIDEFVYDPSANRGSLGLRASLGTVKYASGQIAKKHRQNVNIETPSATIGVRGTDFAMIVDEMGSSAITLLPSCQANQSKEKLECFVGEIVVDTAVGQVVMNQAFQTTVIETGSSAPTAPVILDIDSSQIGNMLIIRDETNYDKAQQRSARERANDLGVDYLEFDGLDFDALGVSMQNLLQDALANPDDILSVTYSDVLQELQEERSSKTDASKIDSETETETETDTSPPLTVINDFPYYRISKTDPRHQFEITVDQEYGYTFYVQQEQFSVNGFNVGYGTSSIRIEQR